MLVKSKGAVVVFMCLVSIVTEFIEFQFIFAPNFSSISQEILTSLIFGKFSIVQIPSINLDTYILEKTDENSLKESVTKFYGGDINTQGNFCIAGHNFKNDKMFGDLYKVKVGDKIVIQDNYGRSLDYIVYDVYKTSPKDLECLKQDEEGSIQITLITCTTAALKRLIVKAKVIYD